MTKNQPKNCHIFLAAITLSIDYLWTVTWTERVFTVLKGGRNSHISFVAIWI